MAYKTGEEPKLGDSVSGEIEGAPARGRIIRVGPDDTVLMERRKPYEGPTKPLGKEYRELPAAELSLVYRYVKPFSAETPVVAQAQTKAKNRAKGKKA